MGKYFNFVAWIFVSTGFSSFLCNFKQIFQKNQCICIPNDYNSFEMPTCNACLLSYEIFTFHTLAWLGGGEICKECSFLKISLNELDNVCNSPFFKGVKASKKMTFYIPYASRSGSKNFGNLEITLAGPWCLDIKSIKSSLFHKFSLTFIHGISHVKAKYTRSKQKILYDSQIVHLITLNPLYWCFIT